MKALNAPNFEVVNLAVLWFFSQLPFLIMAYHAYFRIYFLHKTIVKNYSIAFFVYCAVVHSNYFGASLREFKDDGASSFEAADWILPSIKLIYALILVSQRNLFHLH